MSALAVSHQKPRSFYPRFTRKAGDPMATHYCPGCGHGVLHKLIAEAIDDLGIQDQTILVSPSVAPCLPITIWMSATFRPPMAERRPSPQALSAADPRALSSVIKATATWPRSASLKFFMLRTAENITVFFVNNAIYGMTGGQMAPTTLLGRRRPPHRWAAMSASKDILCGSASC